MNNYTERMKKGLDYFRMGYNCSQAVVLAFSDLTGLDETTSLKLASSFGGGMGKMREVCGAVSGMFMAAGLILGYDSPDDAKAKSEHYALIRELADEFKAQNKSIICRELLSPLNVSSNGEPEARTDEYYKKRPCPELVAECIGIMERKLASLNL